MANLSSAPNPKKRAAEADTGMEPATKKLLSPTDGEFGWQSGDDVALFNGIQMRTQFRSMNKYGGWSGKWTTVQLEAHWRQVLYDEQSAEKFSLSIANSNEKRRRSKFTESELKVLDRVIEPDFPGFEALFEQNRQIWHPSRTLTAIQNQAARKFPATDKSASAPSKRGSKAADTATKTDKPKKTAKAKTPKKTKETVPPAPTPQSLMASYRWEDHQGVIAVIYGQKIFYEVKEPQTIIGRKPTAPSANDQLLHINLSDEGDASKISRAQAQIDWTGSQFTITLLGKAKTLVNEQKLEPDQPIPLQNNSILTFSTIELHWVAKQ